MRRRRRRRGGRRRRRRRRTCETLERRNGAHFYVARSSGSVALRTRIRLHAARRFGGESERRHKRAREDAKREAEKRRPRSPLLRRGKERQHRRRVADRSGGEARGRRGRRGAEGAEWVRNAAACAEGRDSPARAHPLAEGGQQTELRRRVLEIRGRGEQRLDARGGGEGCDDGMAGGDGGCCGAVDRERWVVSARPSRPDGGGGDGEVGRSDEEEDVAGREEGRVPAVDARAAAPHDGRRRQAAMQALDGSGDVRAAPADGDAAEGDARRRRRHRGGKRRGGAARRHATQQGAGPGGQGGGDGAQRRRRWEERQQRGRATPHGHEGGRVRGGGKRDNAAHRAVVMQGGERAQGGEHGWLQRHYEPKCK